MFLFQFVLAQKNEITAVTFWSSWSRLTLLLVLRHSEGEHILIHRWKSWREQCKCKRSRLSFCILSELSYFHQAERRLQESAVSSYLLLQRNGRYSTLSPLTTHQCDHQSVSRMWEKSMCASTWERFWWAEVVYSELDIKSWDTPVADLEIFFIFFSLTSLKISRFEFIHF